MYPVSFLWAAHIKKRELCSDDERRDVGNIAMLACLFGCDVLFEHGYVSVDANGRLICLSNITSLPPAVRDRLEFLDLRHVGAHTASSAKYFLWHKENRFLQ